MERTSRNLKKNTPLIWTICPAFCTLMEVSRGLVQFKNFWSFLSQVDIISEVLTKRGPFQLRLPMTLISYGVDIAFNDSLARLTAEYSVGCNIKNSQKSINGCYFSNKLPACATVSISMCSPRSSSSMFVPELLVSILTKLTYKHQPRFIPDSASA
jgi:hypothetical protein